jgi:subtilase family serine protease
MNKMRKIRKKTIQLPQKFNLGTMKYESELPLKKSDKKLKIYWKGIIISIILILTVFAILFIALKKYLS